MSAALPSAFRQVYADWGVPADTLDVRYVHGVAYLRVRPLIGADRPVPADRTPPPAALTKLLAWLHPELRRRARRAQHTLATRPWRDTVERWGSEIRPQLQARNLALQDVELGALDDTELAGHLRALVDHAARNLRLHFVLHASDLGPIGLLLVFCDDHGIARHDVVPLLEGGSPATSEPARLLGEIRTAVERSGSAPATVDDLRALTPLVDEYLRTHGHRMVTRYDLDGLTLAEAPAVVMRSVREGRAAPLPRALDGRLRSVRDRLPGAARQEFDVLLREARASMDLRDDNGPHTVEWPLGLLRRGLLHAGDRLTATGRLQQRAHVLELTMPEIDRLLRGVGIGPSPAGIAQRASERAARGRLVAPAELGPPEAPPPLDALPTACARLIRVVHAVMDGLDATASADPMAGTGVGEESYVGVVRRASSPEEAIAALEAGEVLVVPYTTPAYNVVLPIAGALVTAEGGPLSHAAVLARELGIPAVVGVRGALDLPDGVTVRVDPYAGRVSRWQPCATAPSGGW